MIEKTHDYLENHLFAAFVFLLLLVILVYLPTLFGPLLLDDEEFIFNNPNIQSLSNVSNYLHDYYLSRGWTQFSFALDSFIYKQIVPIPLSVGMHITNLLLHCLACVFVWLSLSQFWFCHQNSRPDRRKANQFGFLTAAAWGLHPMAGQPVYHLISRANILAVLFFLAGYYTCLKAYDGFLKGKSIITRYLTLSILSSIFVAVGFGAKPIVISLPFIVWLSAMLIERNVGWRHRLGASALFYLPFLLLFGYYLYLSHKYTGSIFGTLETQIRPMDINFYTQTSALGFYYLPRILFPVNLLYDPAYPLVQHFYAPSFLCSLGLLVGSYILFWKWVPRNPFFLFGLLWFYATVALTSSFIPLADVLAERRVYLPLIGFFLMVVGYFYHDTSLPRPLINRLFSCFLITIFVLFPLLTFCRNMEYVNKTHFWQKEQVFSPQKLRPLFHHVLSLYNEGKTQEAMNVYKENSASIDWEGKKIRFNPKYFHNLLRLLAMNRIDLDRITWVAETAVKKNPRSLSALYTLELAYFFQEEYEPSLQIINRLLKYHPQHEPSLLNKVNIYIIQQEHKKARQLLDKLLKRFPQSEIALQIAIKYYSSLGMDVTSLRQKLSALREANKLNPRQDSTKLIEE